MCCRWSSDLELTIWDRLQSLGPAGGPATGGGYQGTADLADEHGGGGTRTPTDDAETWHRPIERLLPFDPTGCCRPESDTGRPELLAAKRPFALVAHDHDNQGC
jgi:hypothetical protein